MLQLSTIKEQKEFILASLKKKHYAEADEMIHRIMEVDERRKKTQAETDSVLSEANQMAKQIGGLMKEGKKEEAEKIKAKTSELKVKSTTLKDELKGLEEELRNLMVQVPNAAHKDVPEGNSDEDNVVLRSHGDLPKLAEGSLPHWDLIKKYDIIDFELGVKITGAGFPVYKGKGARLQRALINFFLDEAIEAGYAEVQTPIMVNEDSGYGTGQLPDKDGQMYQVPAENFYLIPTAEVPITNMYRDVIVKEEELPLKNVGYTPCFRREAGSWGAHVRGLNRLHQFDKVEIVQVVHPEKSYDVLEEMLGYIESLLKKLELPYRVLNLCGGDLGFAAAFTYDLEVYSAAQDKWLEVSSVSNFDSYQANRLKLRYKDENKKTQLLHTLNGSALALPRIVACILENNQQEGKIEIPEVLRKYTGFDSI